MLDGATRGGSEAAETRPLKSHGLYLVLRDRIASGAWAVGDRLPGEFEIAAFFGVSRATTRRALGRLHAEGLISRHAGLGTHVIRRVETGRVTASFGDMMSQIAALGRDTEIRLIGFDYASASQAVAEALRLPSGAAVQRAIRVRLVGREPFSRLLTHVPAEIGRSYSEHDLATTPLHALLERSGIRVERATQTVSAELATPEVAAALDVEVGSALLSVTRTTYDGSGRGVEHLWALYRPDRYAIQMDMEREPAGAWIPASQKPGATN